MNQQLADLLILKSETIEKIKDLQYRFGLLSCEFVQSTNSQVIEENIGQNVYIAKQICVLTTSLDKEHQNLRHYNKEINLFKNETNN